jgi:hypothetical protein
MPKKVDALNWVAKYFLKKKRLKLISLFSVKLCFKKLMLKKLF